MNYVSESYHEKYVMSLYVRGLYWNLSLKLFENCHNSGYFTGNNLIWPKPNLGQLCIFLSNFQIVLEKIARFGEKFPSLANFSETNYCIIDKISGQNFWIFANNLKIWQLIFSQCCVLDFFFLLTIEKSDIFKTL